MNVSTSDLFLAFRQAKVSQYFEKRGVGLVDLAKYESDLESNLARLQEKLKNGDGWFSGVPIGQVWVVPKRRRRIKIQDNQIIEIGGERLAEQQGGLDVSIRLTPSPEFSIVEVLYLWEFGPALDAIVPKQAVGYRLDIRNGGVRKHSRWLFEYWPRKYNQFRKESLEAAQEHLKDSEIPIEVLSADLASFYDTIDARFLLGQDILQALSRPAENRPALDLGKFRSATESLLSAHSKFQRKVKVCTGLDWKIGVPIGALTSRVIANVALASLDDAILKHPHLISYRRYVDDFVIVGRSERPESNSIDSVIGHYIPLSGAKSERFDLNVDTLKRHGSTFCLQREKCRAYRLTGQEGHDFLSAISADFRHLVSERRAFIDSSIFDPKEARRIIRAGKDAGTPVRSLRDADRTKLEHFALSTALSSLERMSTLVNNQDARRIVKGAVQGLERLVADHDSWVESLDSAFRLLGIAAGVKDWDEVNELVERTEILWGDVETLRGSISGLYYRDIEIKSNSAWIWLRNYLHEARLESLSCSISYVENFKDLPEGLQKGLNYRTRKLSIKSILNIARKLSIADLRALDRENDILLRGSLSADKGQAPIELQFDHDLSARIGAISDFVGRVRELGDQAWWVDPVRLFLSTRPPSYFDISLRCLYEVESLGFNQNIFEELLELVNAVRGTDYRHAVGHVISETPPCVQVPTREWDRELRESYQNDPCIILGNLVVDHSWFDAALKKNPIESIDRLRGLATVLRKAASVAGSKSFETNQNCLLILPELALPRRWFREVANYVSKHGSFGLVVGLEYLHHQKQPHVYNQVYAVFPGPFGSVATWPWTKRRPADSEAEELKEYSLSFMPGLGKSRSRVVVDSLYGQLSVLICSELLEVRRVADLLRRAELIAVPSWNKDTASYDHLIQTVGMQLHAIVAIANNGFYSDCRAWAPEVRRWARDMCRLIERQVDDVVHVDFPLASLRRFHSQSISTRAAVSETVSNYPDWRPLPPDWALPTREEDV